jgi:hypothetical protein
MGHSMYELPPELIEQLRRMHEQLQKAVPRNLFDNLQQVFRQIQFRENILQLQKSLRPITLQLAQLTKTPWADFSRLAELWLETVKEMDEIDDSDFPYKWLGALPLSTYRWLFRLYKAGKIQDVEAYLLGCMRTPKVLDEFRKTFQSNIAFQDSLHIIEDAVWAHQQGKYTLSIPALMPQVEGIIRRMGDALKVPKIKAYSSCGKKKRRPLYIAEVLHEIRKQKHDGFFGFFTEHLIQTFFSKQRNPILHGNEPHYGTEQLSAECLWVLYELASSV